LVKVSWFGYWDLVKVSGFGDWELVKVSGFGDWDLVNVSGLGIWLKGVHDAAEEIGDGDREARQRVGLHDRCEGER